MQMMKPFSFDLFFAISVFNSAKTGDKQHTTRVWAETWTCMFSLVQGGGISKQLSTITWKMFRLFSSRYMMIYFPWHQLTAMDETGRDWMRTVSRSVEAPSADGGPTREQKWKRRYCQYVLNISSLPPLGFISSCEVSQSRRVSRWRSSRWSSDHPELLKHPAEEQEAPRLLLPSWSCRGWRAFCWSTGLLAVYGWWFSTFDALLGSFSSGNCLWTLVKSFSDVQVG